MGVAACLYRQGLLPNPNDDVNASSTSNSPPRITGVSAGSMVAVACLAGVDPERDGMEVILEASRKTREYTDAKPKLVPYLDVLTPGFSLIDAVEDPFRKLIVNALGGRVSPDVVTSDDNYDIDPELFARRFPIGSMRLGLADRRALTTPTSPILESYRYVDSFRNVDDIIAACMLSSYIPGGTGPVHLHDKVPDFLKGLFNRDNATIAGDGSMKTERAKNDTVHRSGNRLRDMESVGLVRHGQTGFPTRQPPQEDEMNSERNANVVASSTLSSTDFWDGGIVDVFPTFDDKTIIIAPVNGQFINPAICPVHSPEWNLAEEGDNTSAQELMHKLSPLYLQALIRSKIPTTFRHCGKAHLGLNTKNAKAALKMIFSSDDDELYRIFTEGYDDAKRFLNESGQLRVFAG